MTDETIEKELAYLRRAAKDQKEAGREYTADDYHLAIAIIEELRARLAKRY